MSLVDAIRARRQAIERELASLAPGPPPRIVCVTKTHPIEVVRAAIEAGCDLLGENYAQELASKHEALGEAAVRWHFIGRLQTRRIATVARVADVVESLARLEEARRLASMGYAGDVLVQVAPPGAPPGRNGVDAREAGTLIEQVRELGLRLRGVMGVALPGPEDEVRRFFRTLTGLAEAYGLPERSFGMSADWRVATTEGATLLRLGTALLGPRPE